MKKLPRPAFSDNTEDDRIIYLEHLNNVDNGCLLHNRLNKEIERDYDSDVDEDTEDNLEEIEKTHARCIDFCFGLTNARSLWRKLDSLHDYFSELGQSFAIVTETWFYSGPELDRFTADAKSEFGLSFINNCRKRSSHSNPGGGVSIIFDPEKN